MKTDAIMFRRFVAESLGQIPDDLRGWALQVMLSTLEFDDRIAERDRALNLAADLLPPDMFECHKARRLSEEMRAVRRSTLPANPDLTTVRGCIAHALLACDRAISEKQIRKRLTVLPFAPLQRSGDCLHGGSHGTDDLHTWRDGRPGNRER